MTIIKISQVDIILSCVKHSESIWLICNNKETKKLILCSFNHYIDRICKQGVINDYYFSLIEETLYILTLRTTIKTATSHMPHLCLLSSTGLWKKANKDEAYEMLLFLLLFSMSIYIMSLLSRRNSSHLLLLACIFYLCND